MKSVRCYLYGVKQSSSPYEKLKKSKVEIEWNDFLVKLKKYRCFFEKRDCDCDSIVYNLSI